MKGIRLRNFQCWEKLQIKFDRVTSIVGPTDSGKSAIIRALRWLCLGKPVRNRFIRNGEMDCSVSVLLDNGTTITKKKGKKGNSYLIDKKKLKRDRVSDIPDEVVSLLNIDENNFQPQLSLHFWFSDTPGQVSKNLNQIVNLESIDRSLQDANKLVRESKLELEVCLRRLKTTEKNVETLQWTEPLFKRTNDLYTQGMQIIESEKRADKLTELLEECSTLQQRLTSWQKIPETGKAKKLLEKIQVEEKRYKRLRDHLSEITQAIDDLEVVNQSLSSLEEEMHRKKQGSCPLCGNKF